MQLLSVLVMLLVGCAHQNAPLQPMEQQEIQREREASPSQPEQPVQGTERQDEDLCNQISARTKSLIEPLRERFGETSGCRPPPAGLGWCERATSGTWAVSLEELSMNSDDVIEGHWSIVHVDRGGRRIEERPNILPRTESEPWNVNFSASPCYSMLEIDRPTPFDFNADGTPELILPMAFRAAEEASLYGGRVWTVARNGNIERYPPSAEFIVHEVRDTDGDNRPDLVVHKPYMERSTSCASAFSLMAMGPPLLAHSLDDGTFSTSDDVAAAFARTSCPAPPTSIVERYDEGSVDSARTTNAVVCARLWGVETAALVAQLRRECAPPPRFARDNECATCSELALYERWAAIDPPLRLH